MAQKYAKFSPMYWEKGTGRDLHGNIDAQLVSVYLFGCKHANPFGLYRLPYSYVVEDTGMPMPRVVKAMKTLMQLRYALYDQEKQFVWVVNASTYQIEEELVGGDSRKRWIISSLRDLPKHPFVRMWFNKYAEPYGLAIPSWVNSIDPPSGGGETSETPKLPPVDANNHSNNHSHSHSNNKQPQPHPGSSSDGVSGERVQAVFARWSDCRKLKHPRGPEPRLDEKRRETIESRLDEGFDVETLCDAVEGIWLSSWHLGNNDRGTEYTDVRHAIGDAQKVEKFAELTRKLRDDQGRALVSIKGEPATSTVVKVAEKPAAQTELPLAHAAGDHE